MQQQHSSEVARLRAEIQAAYDASFSALHLLASGMARHDFITAKLARIDEQREALIPLVGEEGSIALVAAIFEGR